MSQNLNQNKNSQSGITFTFRLSETLFAVILTAGVSFGGGFTVANSQQSTGNNQQSNVNCSVQNQSTHRKSTTLD